MQKIKNIEKVTDIYAAWQPSDLAFIKNLEWSALNLTITFWCQLRINTLTWPDIKEDFFELRLKFNNVQNLKIEFSSGLQQVSGFDIVDVSNNYLGKTISRLKIMKAM